MISSTDQTPAVETERAVLGAVLLDSRVMDEIHDLLEPRDFTTASHELIWKAMKYLYEKDKPIDFLTVSNMLVTYDRLEEVGGISYLTGLAESTPSAANAVYYAKIIRSRAFRRRGQEAANAIYRMATEGEYENDEDYFNDIERVALSIRPQTSSGMKHLSETKDEYIAYLEEQDDFIFTGFKKFDEWMGGVGRGWLYILAGRPSVGKTAKALQMAVNIAKQNVGPVLIWSQEMRRNQLLNRMLSPLTGVNSNRIRKKDLEPHEKQRLLQGYDQLAKLPLYIEDAKNVTIEEVRATARQIKRKNGRLAAIFIDYLTIMKIPQKKGETRSQAVGNVTRTAKQVALELDCPIFMLAQLSREGAGEPKLEHLRDSGEIEQDADVVEFLWHDPNESMTPDGAKIVQCTIAKGRDVGVNHFKYKFKGWIQKYEDYQ